jgi:hypothetical protein
VSKTTSQVAVRLRESRTNLHPCIEGDLGGFLVCCEVFLTELPHTCWYIFRPHAANFRASWAPLGVLLGVQNDLPSRSAPSGSVNKSTSNALKVIFEAFDRSWCDLRGVGPNTHTRTYRHKNTIQDCSHTGFLHRLSGCSVIFPCPASSKFSHRVAMEVHVRLLWSDIEASRGALGRL